MTPVVLIPDVEALLFEWLSVQPELADLPPRAPTVWTGHLPVDWLTQRPLILLQRIGGVPDQRPLVHDHPVVQFSVYGGTRNQAHLIASTVRGVIDSRFGSDVPNAAVDRWGNLSEVPDVISNADGSKSLPRFIFDLTLTTKGSES